MLSYRSVHEDPAVAADPPAPGYVPDHGPNSDRIGLLEGEVGESTPLLEAAGREGDTARAAGRSRLGPQTKEQALQRHEANLRQVATVMEAGRRAHDPDPKSPDHLLRNAVQWLDAGLAELVVVSPTHDSHQRRDVKEGQRAFFDSRVPFGKTGADYQKGESEGILVNDDGKVGGYRARADRLVLFDPGAISPSEIASLIVHEVQHDADQSSKDQRWEEQPSSVGAVDPCTAEAWNVYQSEFRAYWTAPPTDSTRPFPAPREGSIAFPITAVYRRVGQPDLTQTVSTGFHNARQEAIFRHLLPSAPDDVYKDETQEGPGRWIVGNGYLPHYYAFDPGFKAMVDGLTEPSGGNLVSSIRIEALAAAIEEGDMARVREAATKKALDPTDRAFLADRQASGPFWDRARLRLSAEDYAELEALLGTGEEQAPEAE